MEEKRILELAKVGFSKFIKNSGTPVYRLDKEDYIAHACFQILKALSRESSKDKPEAYFQKIAIKACSQKRWKELEHLRDIQAALINYFANSRSLESPWLEESKLEYIYNVLVTNFKYSQKKAMFCLLILAEISDGNQHSERIARELKVSHQYVNRIRKQLQFDLSKLVK